MKKLLKFLFPKTTQQIFEDGSLAGANFAEDRTRIKIDLNGRNLIYLTVAEWRALNVLRGEEASCLYLSFHARADGKLEVRCFPCSPLPCL